MKEKVVVLRNSVSDAFLEGMSAIEVGRYAKVIKLLNYVRENSDTYDKMMLEYALLISYVNTNKLDEAKKCLDNLDEIYINNDQIKDVIETIRRDVINRDLNLKKEVSTTDFVQLVEELQMTVEKISKLYTMYPDDMYIEILYKGIVEKDIESQNEFVKEYTLAKIDVKEFVNVLKNFIEFNETTKPIHLFESLNAYENDTLRWMLIKPNDINIIYQNRALPSFIRKYVLERAVHFIHYGVIIDFGMKINGELISLITLPDFYEGFYDEVKIINNYYEINDNIFDMISSVLNIVYVNGYPDNVFEDKNKIHALVGYIVNDIFVGHRFDQIIYEKTGYTFEDVKVEIKKLELLITFLIS